MILVAIFGPTGVGKTGVAIELAELLRERGEDPVAVSCDAIQVYRGLEILSAVATPEQQARLEHRLVGIVGVDQTFSAGRYAALAEAEIADLWAAGRRPIVVGGAGLYLRAALSEMSLRAPVDPALRTELWVELGQPGGPQRLLAELPDQIAATIHPNDHKKIVRMVEMQRSGQAPTPPGGGELWTARLRRPTLLVGLNAKRTILNERIEARTAAMLAAGVEAEVRAAEAAAASATARLAHGYREILSGDIEAWVGAQRAYTRRQQTWMRKMQGVLRIDRADGSDRDCAGRIVAALDAAT